MSVKEKLQTISDLLLAVLRMLLVILVFAICIAAPILFLVIKVISLAVSALPTGPEAVVGVLLFAVGLGYISYLGNTGLNQNLLNWIQTGHFEFEVSEEKNRLMRQRYLKNHKDEEKRKPKTWKISLTNPSSLVFLSPVFPLKFGTPDTFADPLNYRALVNITHRFRGNLPIEGDEIKFMWVTTSNNNISKLHVRAIEDIPDAGENSAKWIELDANGEAGSVCSENLKTGKRIKITHTIKIAKDCKNRIALCFWNEGTESDGESVLAYKF